jgi:hypothetical protein
MLSGVSKPCRVRKLNGKQVRLDCDAKQYLCCPRNGKQVRIHQPATGLSIVREGGESRLVSPETGLTATLEIPRGDGVVGTGSFCTFAPYGVSSH